MIKEIIVNFFLRLTENFSCLFKFLVEINSLRKKNFVKFVAQNGKYFKIFLGVFVFRRYFKLAEITRIKKLHMYAQDKLKNR